MNQYYFADCIDNLPHNKQEEKLSIGVLIQKIIIAKFSKSNLVTNFDFYLPLYDLLPPPMTFKVLFNKSKFASS